MSVDNSLLEPLAIVGFSLRFPSDATDSESFWKIIQDKYCASTNVPADRFNAKSFYHPAENRTNTLRVQNAYFMNQDLACFDAPFFSISPSEAEGMDPQQRGLLEVSYHALENAGIPIESLAGSNTGVFTGSFSDDYRILNAKDTEQMSKYAAVGTEFSILANRLSWWFDLKGPSFNTDSACASSLTAFHLACQSLRSRESNLALVIGSNILLSIERFLSLSNMSMLSPEGRSYSFDHRADGYARGEGLGVLVLTSLKDALSTGHTIRAVIRSSGINQDGRTPSITSPNQDSQESLIRKTYKKAGLDLKTTAYVEAHGTGTAMGDKTEIRAIGNVFGPERSPKNPLFVGSVKSNIGHLEGGSGIAGIIKAILALEKGLIPPTTNFENPNPAIDIEALNIAIPQESITWPTSGLRRASVNSFGFGGTNGHVVLDDAFNFLRLNGLSGYHTSVDLKESSQKASLTSDNHISPNSLPSRLLLWSANDAGSLKRIATSFEKHLSAQRTDVSPEYLDSLAFTLATRRSKFPVQSFGVLGHSLSPEKSADLFSLPVRRSRASGLAFIFTGQGAQYPEMGLELLHYPKFQNSVERANLSLQALGCEWNLLDELQKSEATSRIHTPELSQTICTALQIALVDLLKHIGVRPKTVVGHSSGEIAAAYAVGAISLDTAMNIAYHRGKVASKLAEMPEIRGAMLAVGMSEAKAALFLIRSRNEDPSIKLSIACINSPKSVTLAGDADVINAAQIQLEKENVFSRRLRVNVAYHSSHVKLVSADYQAAMERGIMEKNPDYSKIDATMISSVTGWPVDRSELVRPEYWVRNMESPVKFLESIEQTVSSSDSSIDSERVHHFLEIGPHSVLKGPVKDTLLGLRKEEAIHYDSVLKRGSGDVDSLQRALGRLHCLGYTVDVLGVNNMSSKHGTYPILTDLPPYPFDHSKRYWFESRLGRASRLSSNGHHDLLGTSVIDGAPGQLGKKWRKITKVADTPWIQDHIINESTIYPAAGMLSMALEAIKQLAEPSRSICSYTVEHVEFKAALRLSLGPEGTESYIYLQEHDSQGDDMKLSADFRLFSLLEEKWVENCCGAIELTYDESSGPDQEMDRFNHKDLGEYHNILDPPTVYEELHAIGMQFGESFQAMKEIRVGPKWSAATSVCPFEWKEGFQDHIVHPATLDGIFQAILVALSHSGGERARTAVPTKLRGMWLSGQGITYQTNAQVNVHAKIGGMSSRKTQATVNGYSSDGERLLSISEVELTFVDSGNREVKTISQPLCYNLRWKPDIDCLRGRSATQYFQSQDFLATRSLFLEHVMDVSNESASRAISELDTVLVSELPLHVRRYLQYLQKVSQARVLSSAMPNSAREDGSAVFPGPTLVESVFQSCKSGKIMIHIGEHLGQVFPMKNSTLKSPSNSRQEYKYEFQPGGIQRPVLKSVIDLAAFKRPGLKILEIGLEYPMVSQDMLDNAAIRGERDSYIKPIARYDFTTGLSDAPTSSLIQVLTKELQGNFVAMDLENTDLEPTSNNFYDLIVLTGEHWYRKSLDRVVTNARKLIRNGGNLVIVDDMIKESLYHAVSGIYPSPDLDSVPPSSAEPWNTTLIEGGFSGVDAVLPEGLNALELVGNIIISSATEEAVSTTFAADRGETGTRDIRIITGTMSLRESDISAQVLGNLRSKGFANATITTISDMEELDMTGKSCIFLGEMYKPMLSEMDERTFLKLRAWLSTANEVLWVYNNDTTQPLYHMSTGLLRVCRAENTTSKYVSLGLYATNDSSLIASKIANIFQSMDKTAKEAMELEFREVNGNINISRAIPAWEVADNIHKTKAATNTASESSTETLSPQPGPPESASLGYPRSTTISKHPKPIASQDIEVEIHSLAVARTAPPKQLHDGVSQQPLSICTGIITDLGQDTTHQAGQTVIGCVNGKIDPIVRGNAHTFVELPGDIETTSVAGICAPFVTAFIALTQGGGCTKDERLFVVDAHTILGQAVLQLAKLIGSTISASVPTDDEKQLLIKTYDLDADSIYVYTHQRSPRTKMPLKPAGVDYLIDFSSQAHSAKFYDCVAPFGRVVRFHGGQSFLKQHCISLPANCTIFNLDVVDLLLQKPKAIGKALRHVLPLIKKNTISRIGELDVHPLSQFAKIVQDLPYNCDESGMKQILFTKEPMLSESDFGNALPYSLSEYATYVIAGGFGEIGISICRWMAKKGARNIVVLSRSGPKSKAAKELLWDLSRQDVRIEYATCDVTSKDAVRAAIGNCSREFPPIAGCIQASLVLQDSVFETMDYSMWKRTVEPRVNGTINLSDALPDKLDFFILLSSGNGVVGAHSQANYAASNTFLDAFPHANLNRRIFTLDLGWHADTIAQNELFQKRFQQFRAHFMMTELDVHGLLDYYCNSQRYIREEQRQVVIGVGRNKNGSSEQGVPELLQRPLWRFLNFIYGDSEDTAASNGASKTVDDIRTQLKNSANTEEATEKLADIVVSKLSAELDLSEDAVDLEKPFHATGVDSLMAVELRVWFKKEIGVNISVFELMGSKSLRKVCSAAVASLNEAWVE